MGKAVPLALTGETDAILCGDRPLEDAQDGAVKRGVDDTAAPGAPVGPVAAVEQ